MFMTLLLQHCALQTVQNIGSQRNWWSERFASKAIVDRLVVILKRSHVDGSRPLAAAALTRVLHSFPALLMHFDSAHGPACLLPGKPASCHSPTRCAANRCKSCFEGRTFVISIKITKDIS